MSVTALVFEMLVFQCRSKSVCFRVPKEQDGTRVGARPRQCVKHDCCGLLTTSTIVILKVAFVTSTAISRRRAERERSEA